MAYSLRAGLLFVLAVAVRLGVAEEQARSITDKIVSTTSGPTAYYYFNEITGAMQYEDPGSTPYDDEAGNRYWVSPNGQRLTEEPNRHQWTWVENWSKEQQRFYFFNQATKEVVWDRPTDLAWRRLPVPREDDLGS